MALLNVILPPDWARTLTDFRGDWRAWANVHLAIWVAFIFGILIVLFNRLALTQERAFAAQPLLNRDANAVYDRQDRQRLYAEASKLPEMAIVRQMVQRTLAQFQGSKSWSQANEVLQATTGEIQHRVELNYTTVRYLTWLIPTLGFIGTVLGIASALAIVGDLQTDELQRAEFLPEVIGALGLAFSTTLLALVLSGILVFAASVIQAAEERFITHVFADCVDNLLNKLHEDD